ncbi:MAG: hypothetical protein IPI67_08040 [Myxococcales bacterium]|nr:hypothetical protein [Myxococcales bacterium]
MWHAKRLTLLKNVSLAPDVIALSQRPGAGFAAANTFLRARGICQPWMIGLVPLLWATAASPT